MTVLARDQRYVCENCGLAGPMSYFQGECRPGWTHGRLIRIETDEQLQGAVGAIGDAIQLLQGYVDGDAVDARALLKAAYAKAGGQ